MTRGKQDRRIPFARRNDRRGRQTSRRQQRRRRATHIKVDATAIEIENCEKVACGARQHRPSTRRQYHQRRGHIRTPRRSSTIASASAFAASAFVSDVRMESPVDRRRALSNSLRAGATVTQLVRCAAPQSTRNIAVFITSRGMCIAVDGARAGLSCQERLIRIHPVRRRASFRYISADHQKNGSTTVTSHFSIDATLKEPQAEVARLRQENMDLRASALLWQRLYEQALQRETRAELESVDDVAPEKKRQKHARSEPSADPGTPRPSNVAALRIASR